MLDALKTLFENDVVSEDVRRELEEAWDAKIKENRLAATAELREEFAQKYEHDKTTMVEAIDSLITERLSEELTELEGLAASTRVTERPARSDKPFANTQPTIPPPIITTSCWLTLLNLLAYFLFYFLAHVFYWLAASALRCLLRF